MTQQSVSIFSTVCLAMVAGCSKPAPKNPMGMDFRDTYGPKQPVIQDTKGRRPILVGKPNLAYMVDQAAVVRVMKVDTGETLVEARVSPGTVVAIDKEEGVYLGDRIIKKGPLDPAAKYAIYLDLPTDRRTR